MNLNYDSFPLNIYKEPTTQVLFSKKETLARLGGFNVIKFIMTSAVKRMSGLHLAFVIENLISWYKETKARNGLSKLIQEQTNRVKSMPSTILKESQINLMATSCVTDHLCNVEAGSFASGVESTVKVAAGIFQGKKLPDTLWAANMEKAKKYNHICLVYHVAFLLSVYKACPHAEDTICDLIKEATLDDNQDPLAFSNRKRPILFSSAPYETLEENLSNNLAILSAANGINDDILDPFVKWRNEINAN